MERKYEIKFAIPVIISVLFHLLILSYFVTSTNFQKNTKNDMLSRDKFKGRDIIVNINPDEVIQKTTATLLSEKDSSARGRTGNTRGDNWLNNSTEFKVRGKTSVKAKTSAKNNQEKLNQETDKGLYSINIIPSSLGDYRDSFYPAPFGNSEWTKIPDHKGINRTNAIYFSNSGSFSFNTMKFKNFEYFRAMKNKISSNWYPPVVNNAILNSRSGPYAGFTPGMVRMITIPSQEVKLYFTMNRKGDVLDVVIVESMKSRALDDSCRDSILNSMNFGKVPADIEGDIVVIPFIFGFYIR